MANFIVSIIALCVLILGVIALISPIPIGIFLIGASVSTLVCVNPRARKILQKLRIKYASINRKVHWLEAKLERKYKHLADAFIKTRPDHPGDDGPL